MNDTFEPYNPDNYEDTVCCCDELVKVIQDLTDRYSDKTIKFALYYFSVNKEIFELIKLAKLEEK